MRITIRIASASGYWKPEIPHIDTSKVFNLESKTFDRAEFGRQIRDCRGVQVASNDDTGVLAFGCDFLRALGDWRDDSLAAKGRELERATARLKAREARGRVGFVRVDLSLIHRDGRAFIRARVRHDDNGVVTGLYDSPTEVCALFIADFLRTYQRLFEEQGMPRLILDDDTMALVVLNHEKAMVTKAAESNVNRKECARNQAGFCAPCKFDCPHFDGGRCIAIPETAEMGEKISTLQREREEKAE